MNLSNKRIYKVGCFALAMLLLFEVTGIGKVLWAQVDMGISPYVEYNEEKTEAIIRFDFQQFDLETNSITSIKAEEEQREIYNIESQADVRETNYSVDKNGKYHFTITYEKKKQGDAAEETAADKQEEGSAVSEEEKELAESKQETEKTETTQVEVSVDVDGIKEENVKEENIKEENIKEEPIIKEEKTVSEEKPKASLSAVRPNTSSLNRKSSRASSGNNAIDLRKEFNIKSFAYDANTHKTLRIAEIENNVTEHSIQMTNPDLEISPGNPIFPGTPNIDENYDYQTTALQSIKTYDMTRPFSLSGTIDLGEGLDGASDGLTIGFTNNASYLDNFDGGQGGSLGVYKDGTHPGIGNGIIAEIDTWGNKVGEGEPFGDATVNRQEERNDAHLDINGVKNDAVTNLTNNAASEWYIKEASNLNNLNAAFNLSWQPSFDNSGTMTLTLGSWKASAYIADITEYIPDMSNAYLIFTTVSGSEFNYPYKPSTVTFTFDNFSYDDIDPLMVIDYTRVYVCDEETGDEYSLTRNDYSMVSGMPNRADDVKAYVQANQQIEVKLRFKNKTMSKNTFDEMLYLSSAQIGDIKAEVVPGSVRYSDPTTMGDIVKHNQDTFNDQDGLEVQYPAKQQYYILYFNLHFTEEPDLDISKGKMPMLNLQIAIGKKSMSQYLVDRKIAVFSKPNVKNIDMRLTNQEVLTKQLLQTNMTSAKTFDDTIYHSAYYAKNEKDNSIRIKEDLQKYLKFDDATNSWKTITETELLNHSLSGSKETGVYAYEYSVTDARRSKLTKVPEKPSNPAVSRYFLANVEPVKANGYTLLMNGTSLRINANDIKLKYNTKEKLEDYIKEQLSLKAYKTDDNGGYSLRKADSITGNITINYESPEIKTYNMTINVFDNEYDSGASSAVAQNISIEVYDVVLDLINTKSIINVNKNLDNYSNNATLNYDYNIAIPQRNLTHSLTENDTFEALVAFKNSVYSKNEETIAVQIPEMHLKNSTQNIKLVLKKAKYGGYGGSFVWLTEEELATLSNGGTVYIKASAEQGNRQFICFFEIPDGYSYSVPFGGNANDLPLASAQLKVNNLDNTITAITAFNPLVNGIRFDFGVNTKQTFNPKQQLVQGRTYDNPAYSNADTGTANGFDVINEKYYYFDDTQFADGQATTEKPKGKYVEISEEKFLNHMNARKDQTEIYAYGYQIQDKRRIIAGTPNLVSPVTYGKYYLTKKSDKEATEAARKGNYLIMANDHLLNLKDTEISSKFSSEAEFISYIEKTLSIKGYRDVVGTLETKLEDVTYEAKTGTIESFLKNPTTGDFIIQAQIKGSDGAVLVSKDITINVSENAWSYDTPNRTEENGASGYIVIPRAVELKENQGTNQLTATSEVYYANYQSAINDVQYQVTVDKQFQLTNTKISTEKLNVTTTGGTDKGTLVDLGTISKANPKGKGAKVTFSTPVSKETKKLGRWEGNVNFYFQRVTP